MEETAEIRLFVVRYFLALLFWLTYAVMEGIKEAFYYNAVDPDEPQNNLHPFFTVQRGLVAVLVLCLSGAWLFIPVLFLVFSFMHNGAYCMKRNDLNPETYAERWKGESTTSRAIFEFSYRSRLTQFIAGLVIHLSSLFFYLL
jgi:hypothetical protein